MPEWIASPNVPAYRALLDPVDFPATEPIRHLNSRPRIKFDGFTRSNNGVIPLVRSSTLSMVDDSEQEPGERVAKFEHPPVPSLTSYPR